MLRESLNFTELVTRLWRNGLRAAFRTPWAQALGGSNPSSRTSLANDAFSGSRSTCAATWFGGAERSRDRPHNKVSRQERPKHCVEVHAYSKAWPCFFPQHGPGKKHTRRIVLTRWQDELVARWPDALLRGLIHSDGCRFMNTGRNWRHVRYSFCSLSEDIKTIFCDACDRMGLRWTRSGRKTIYVSRKADIAALDRIVGPKR
jgi:hypothetical protein